MQSVGRISSRNVCLYLNIMERDVTQLLLLKAPRSIERVELNGSASFRKCDPVSRETSDRVVNSLMQELFCQNFFFFLSH